MEEPTQDRVYIVWTSPDRDTALRMPLSYCFNSKAQGWWKEVCLILWGPSIKLAVADPEIQNKLAELQHLGVEVLACSSCVEAYGLSAELAELRIEVKGMGPVLTEALKDGYRVLTV